MQRNPASKNQGPGDSSRMEFLPSIRDTLGYVPSASRKTGWKHSGFTHFPHLLKIPKRESKFYLKGAGGEIAQKVRVLAASWEALRLVPRIYLEFQVLVTPAPGNLILSSGLQGHLCMCVHTHAPTHSNINKYLAKEEEQTGYKFYPTVVRTLILWGINCSRSIRCLAQFKC